MPRFAEGCINAGEITRGPCLASDNTGTKVNAEAEVNIGQWEKQMFCVLRTQGSEWQDKNNTLCNTAKGYTMDSGNHCFKVPPGWGGGTPIT